GAQFEGGESVAAGPVVDDVQGRGAVNGGAAEGRAVRQVGRHAGVDRQGQAAPGRRRQLAGEGDDRLAGRGRDEQGGRRGDVNAVGVDGRGGRAGEGEVADLLLGEQA